MDDNLRKIFEKWDNFKQTHTKLYMPERRALVLELYDRVRLELQDIATFRTDDQDTTMTIFITSDSFVTSDEIPALRNLIQYAHTFRAYIQDGRIVFDLWFSFWDWIPKP